MNIGINGRIYTPVSGKTLSLEIVMKTRSSWLNCVLRDDEAVYRVSIGHYEAVAVGNWAGHLCLYTKRRSGLVLLMPYSLTHC